MKGNVRGILSPGNKLKILTTQNLKLSFSGNCSASAGLFSPVLDNLFPDAFAENRKPSIFRFVPLQQRPLGDFF